MSESTNKATRQRILDATLPQLIETRLDEVGLFNRFYLEMEQRDRSPAMPQRTFEAVFKRARIIHAIWDEEAARLGTGTMLLQGDAEFCSIYGSGNDAKTVTARSDAVGELTIRVADEASARELKRLFANGTATLRRGEVAFMKFCIDRPRPDGTTFRQTLQVIAAA